MKTRIQDVPAGFSFQYGDPAEGKTPRTWHHVGGRFKPQAWATTKQRDLARACFTHRRTVQAALADLVRARLLTP